MKKLALIPLLFFVPAKGFSQRIQYSRQTFPSPFADAVQMVGDVAGYHHVLCFTAGKKPLLYVFDRVMQSFTKTEINVKLKENCDVRTLPFRDYYLLYLHVPGTVLHQLFKVDSEGQAEDVSQVFSAGTDTAWNRSTATFQLFNKGNRLAVITHTYYDAIKKIGSRLVTFDAGLANGQANTVFFPFDKDFDILQQVMLSGNSLLALKTVRNPEHGNSLDVLKLDMASGSMVGSSFASGSLLYINPAMHVNAADSSLTLSSSLREPMNASRFQRMVFIAHVDSLLHQKTPPVTFRSPFRSNTAASFLLVNGTQARWLASQNTSTLRRDGIRYGLPKALDPYDPAGINISVAQSYGYESEIRYNMPTAVHFTVLSEGLKTIKDSVVENRGSFYNVQPRPHAQFTLGKKAYLLLIENFSAKKHGLLLFTGNEAGGLSTISLPVFDRYEYMLPQVQATKDYFILPYSYKNEIGLVKISLTE